MTFSERNNTLNSFNLRALEACEDSIVYFCSEEAEAKTGLMFKFW